MEQANKPNPGKGMSLGGLIMGIIALIGGIGVLFICMGWAAFDGGYGGAMGLAIGWTSLALVALLLCVMGRKKSKAAGSKTGTATFGMVVAILAILFCGGIFKGIMMVEHAREYVKEHDKKMDSAATEMKDDGQRLIDSINAANGQ
jgi:hypothetical protein